MEIKFAPLKYKIYDYVSGCKPVHGFAVRSALPVRFCVRETQAGWKCDHYDTGAGFGPEFYTKEDAALFGEVKMRWAIKNGALDAAIDDFYKRTAKQKP